MEQRAVLQPQGPGRFRVKGDLGFDTVPELAAQAPQLFEGGLSVTVDLRGVTRSDSAGLALLVEWMRFGRRRGQAIRYTNVPAQLLAIARLSGLKGVLPFAPAASAERLRAR